MLVNLQAQGLFAVNLSSDFGRLIASRFESNYRPSSPVYMPRVAPNLSVDARISKYPIYLSLGIRYSASQLLIEERGGGVFKGEKGFEPIKLENNQLELPLLLRIRCLKTDKWLLMASFGTSINLSLRNNTGTIAEVGTQKTFINGEVWILDYRIEGRSTLALGKALESGLDLHYALKDDLFVSLGFYYRLGLFQTIDLQYSGVYYAEGSPDSYENSSFMLFANSGVFAQLGMKKSF